jgi:sodium-dependent dicarboxylate transporter 2/3/5
MSGKQWLMASLGIIFLLFFLIVPPIAPLTATGMKIIGIFLFTVIWWAVVDTGFTSILCVALFVLTGALPAKEAFAISFGDWLPLFLLGSYGLGTAISVTGYSRRFALWFVTRPFTEGHPWLLVSMFLLGCTFLGMFVSLSVACIVFMSIAEPMLHGLGYKKGDRFAAMLMMGIAWAATASSAMTPIGHATNMFIMEQVKKDLGYTIGFGQWMLIGVPLGLIAFLMVLLVFRFVVRPDVSKFNEMAAKYVAEEAKKLGPMTTGEKVAIAVFGTVILWWMFPSTLGLLMPELAVIIEKLGYTIPALVGAVALCLIRVKGRPVLTFRQWMEGVEWSAIMLVSAIQIIANTLGKPELGITSALTSLFSPVTVGAPFTLFLIVTMLWVVIQTNIMSNMVSASTVYAIMLPAALVAGHGNPVALAFCIAAASEYAFSLPSATTSTAIVTGSGWVPPMFMVKYGVLLILPIVLLFAFLIYPLSALIFN